MGEAAIVVRGLRKSFGAKEAVAGIDLDVAAGSCAGLVGPNAALVWRDIMPPVADAHYKAIAPNLPGFASSEHKQVQYTIAYQAEALAQMIDEMKLDHVAHRSTLAP